MYQKSTQYLNEVLGDARSKEGLQKYLDNLKKDNDDIALNDYFNFIISSKNLTIADIVKESTLNKDYAYQILNGRKVNPNRMKVLALCIGAHMNYAETQRALEIAHCGVLYPRNPADAIIIYHLNSENWSVIQINLDLEEHGFPIIE